MDKSLDDIIQGSNQHRGGGRRRGGGQGRGGVGKHNNNDRRHHNNNRRLHNNRRGAKTVMITNLYYDLTEDDLDGLFSRVGPIEKIKIQYDRSGRSEGYAWVTYRNPGDAHEAVKKFDGKKAAGQTISLTIAPGYFHEGFRGNDFSDRLSRTNKDTQNSDKRGKTRRPRKDVNELDAELDAYMNHDEPQQKKQQGDGESTAKNAEANGNKSQEEKKSNDAGNGDPSATNGNNESGNPDDEMVLD